MAITSPYATHFVTDLGRDLAWENVEHNESGFFPRYAVWTTGREAECVETFHALDALYNAWPELENLSITVIK